jgi:ribulose-5-phosphate 4-epimerase/fuculose-1-phosphate aldolase
VNTNYAILDDARSDALARLVGHIEEALAANSFTRTELDDADFVLNLIDHDDPKSFRRRNRGIFAAALHERAETPGLVAEYPLLVRALANIVLAYVPGEGVWFTTMEQGHFLVEGDGPEPARAVVAQLLAVATARLVIDNEFRTDLEPELWDGDEITREIQETGERLDKLGLLPNPFPLEEILSERDLRHVKRLYSIGGLSYGNLSMRKDETRFWMSASGVDKSKLETPGRDILLVSDYDEENGRIVLSVPPGVEPRRVSVDAIEHWMIYQAHPDGGAILHVHAWMEGIAATDVNYPCGTQQLAVAVADLVAREPDPAHAVIGLRNHGLTCTGDSLSEILDRVAPKVLRQVPMS